MARRETKLYAGDAAARAGMSRPTWNSYRSRGLPRNNPVPEPDGIDHLRGHACPFWYPSTVDSWTARRPGHGGRPPA